MKKWTIRVYNLASMKEIVWEVMSDDIDSVYAFAHKIRLSNTHFVLHGINYK